jgi:hypothetical protein
VQAAIILRAKYHANEVALAGDGQSSACSARKMNEKESYDYIVTADAAGKSSFSARSLFMVPTVVNKGVRRRFCQRAGKPFDGVTAGGSRPRKHLRYRLQQRFDIERFGEDALNAEL